MSNPISRIITGWFYFFFKNESVEKIASNREAICMNCKYSKFYNKIDEWKYSEFALPKDPAKLYCSQCNSCPITKLIRSPKSKCPKEYW